VPFWDHLFSRCDLPTQLTLLHVCQRINRVGMTESNVMRRIVVAKRRAHLKNNPSQDFRHFNSLLKENKTLDRCLRKIKSSPIDIYEVPDDRKTPEICMDVAKSNGYCLKYIPPDKQTPEVCIAAIKSSVGGAVPYIHPSQLTAEVKQVADQFGNGLYPLDYVCFDNSTNAEILECLQHKPKLLRFLPYEKRTRELCFIAVSNDPTVIEYVPLNCLTSEICLLVIRQNPSAFWCYHPDFLHPDLG